MSVWFMYDNHTFLRLDDKPIDEAMALLEKAVKREGGYGFIGAHREVGREIFQWRPGEPWQERAREMIQTTDLLAQRLDAEYGPPTRNHP